jgi:hypothetical protein
LYFLRQNPTPSHFALSSYDFNIGLSLLPPALPPGGADEDLPLPPQVVKVFPCSWSAGQAVLAMGHGEQGDQHQDRDHSHLQVVGTAEYLTV